MRSAVGGSSTTTHVRRSGQIINGMRSGRTTPQESALIPDTSTPEVRDDHYPVCRLDIWQDSEFATRYGYPKTAFKREPDTDIRNAFIDISRVQTFGKSSTLHTHSLIIFIQKHLFSFLCHESESVCGVISVL